MAKQLTKIETIRELQNRFPESNFLVNVIITRHRNPARKLQGVLTLLQAGHSVNVAPGDMLRLVVNGYPWTWTELECGPDYINKLVADQAAMDEEESDPRCGCCCVELNDDYGKALGCYGCAKAFCSAGCLESHERTTGHGENSATN